MTCESARAILEGPWTPSAAIAFTRHWADCLACQEYVKGLNALIPETEREAMADEFRRTCAPQMARALLTDPEAR